MNSNADKFFRFCPHCGRHYGRRQKKDVLVCSQCGFNFYQNSKPTVSAFFRDGKGRIMLVKRSINPKKGWWDAPGGFLTEGEDPVSGLRREIREELGVGLSQVRYFGVYMDRYRHGYDLHVLNIVYLAAIASGRLRATDDVSAFRWFSARDIPWPRLGFPWLTPALRDWVRLQK